MLKLMNYNLPYFVDKDVVYIGGGREKISFEKFIGEHGQIKSFQAVDHNSDTNFQKELKKYDPKTTVFVKSSDIPGRTMTVPYTTVTRIFFDAAKQLEVRTVGVTGTKGKTTTSSLLSHILKDAGLDARLCSEVGTPLLDGLENTTNETVIVAALSSFQLAELQQSPNIAIITNLNRDHVDYHGSLELYWEAKRNIIRSMKGGSAVVYSPRDEVVLHWLATGGARQIPIDTDEFVDISKAKLIGDYNKSNYLQAKAAATLFGVSAPAIQASFNSFEPVQHRLQPVRSARGVTFVDDAVGSTPEITIQGITALIQSRGPVGCVMLGGKDKDYDYTELVKLLHRVGIPKLVFFPETGPIIETLVKETEGYTPDTFNATDMDEAVQWAYENTPSGSFCLLSTAAPSTSLWRNYEEKGNLFQKAVVDLPS